MAALLSNVHSGFVVMICTVYSLEAIYQICAITVMLVNLVDVIENTRT